MKSMISDYRHHCGSTAMRNLLFYYHDLDLSEAFTFGLGSGIEQIANLETDIFYSIREKIPT